MNIYDFSAVTSEGKEISLEQYKGKALLIVNTASKCGFTPQYKDLEALYEKYAGEGLEILGFPCNQFHNQEPGSGADAKNFCEINYGVTFPIFDKVDVNGLDAHPIFNYLKMEAPYKGIDTTSGSGKLLHAFLSENYPESLVGDSIKWNFTKFLIDRTGKVVNRFESTFEPMDMEVHIKEIV